MDYKHKGCTHIYDPRSEGHFQQARNHKHHGWSSSNMDIQCGWMSQSRQLGVHWCCWLACDEGRRLGHRHGWKKDSRSHDGEGTGMKRKNCYGRE